MRRDSHAIAPTDLADHPDGATFSAGERIVDNLKIAIRLLVRSALVGAAIACTGCAQRAPEPMLVARAPVKSSLVRGAMPSVGDGRNDAALGERRLSVQRQGESLHTTVYDRQVVLNGRVYGDYSSRTRTNARVRR